MATTDIFPVDPDYPVSRSRAAEVLAFAAASGERFHRTRAPLARVFDLSFLERAVADWESIEEFRLTHREEFFTFEDKSLSPSRDFSCYFAGEPQYDEVGNDEVNIRAQLVEAVNQPLRNFPTTPLLTLKEPGVDVGTGIVFRYPGYGFKITGSLITSVELDGVSLGLTLQKFDVNLLLHTLKVIPNTATVTKVEFVH